MTSSKAATYFNYKYCFAAAHQNFIIEYEWIIDIGGRPTVSSGDKF